MTVDLNGVMHASISETFSLSNDQIAQFVHDDPRSNRFGLWCGNDLGKIKQVLDTVGGKGISPAWFASWEINEGLGYTNGGIDSWLNHFDNPQGDWLQDAGAVADWITATSQVKGGLAWIDAGNPVDFVPADVKAKGEADFASMSLGTIGVVYLQGTAAATWAYYYPNGLLAEYNQVQNYGDPFAGVVDTINAMGGSIGGTPSKPKPPTQNPNKKPPSNGGKPTKPKDPEITLKNGRLQVVGRTLQVMEQSPRFIQSGPGEYLITGGTSKQLETPGKPSTGDKGHANNNKPSKPKPPSTSLKPVSDIAGLLGQTVGSGQCYALADWWAQHNGTPALIAQNGTNNTSMQAYPEQPLAWAAANIGGDFDWNAWGWDVMFNTSWENARPGDIACMGVGTYAQTARIGHVVVIKDVSNGNIGFYEQNGAYGQIVAETGNPAYPYLIGMTSTYNYWDCEFKTLIRKR